MSEGHLWLYIANEEQVGPVNGEQLQQLAASAEIDPTTPVWTESLDEWTTADQIEGLFPDPVAVGGSRLITGSAAQTATPLAGAPVASEPLDVAPVATAGFALGGSLASSPHAISPGLQPAQATRFQIRSVGILQAGIVMALLMSITALLTLLVFMSFSSIIGGMAGGTDVSGLFAIGGIMLVIVPIVYGIIGFIYGIFAALIYNLAAKMCGGLVLRVQTTQF
jgi:hypothetical protein